jgi:histone H3/H4
MTKAAEMFILELTLNAWQTIPDEGRTFLQKKDIKEALATMEKFDFMCDLLEPDV